MAKASFTEVEQTSAKKGGTVLVAFAVYGKHAPGFAYKTYFRDAAVGQELAEEAIEFFDGWMKRVKAAEKKT